MTSPRAFLLEAGLAAILIVILGSFGAVHPWGYNAAASLIFLLVLIKPEAVYEFAKFPLFTRFCLALVFFWVLIQSIFFSFHTATSLDEVRLWLACGAAMLLARCLKRTAIIRFFLFLSVLGAASAVYGTYQVVSGSEKVLWETKQAHLGFVTGTYFNRNHFAGLMEMVLGVHLGCLVRALHKGQKRQGGLLFLMLLPSFMGLAKSGSRAGIIFFIVSVVILSAVLIRRAEKKRGLILLLLFIAAGAGLAVGWETVALRFTDASDELLSLDGRRAAWQSVLPMLKSYGLTGTGLGCFKWAFPAFQPASLGYSWTHAHQDYLELAIEIGIPAAFLCAAGIFCAVLQCLRRTECKDFSTFALVWGAATGIFSISLHGLTDFNFAIPGQSLIFFLILGAAHRLLDYDKQAVPALKESD